MSALWCVWTISLSLFLSCEADIEYKQTQLTINLNPCLSLLNFDEVGGCGSHWEASRDGCFVKRNHLDQTLSLPVRFDPEGLTPINGQSDLVGDLGHPVLQLDLQLLVQ